MMTPSEITDQLERIAAVDNFAVRSEELVDQLERSATGVEAVEPILRFMEAHPSVDFGAPGALVHYMERFYGHGYENKVLESLKRRPIGATAWMLNRIINGTKDPLQKEQYVSALHEARMNPSADLGVVAWIDRFIGRMPK